MPDTRPQFIYKLLWPAQWAQMQADGRFAGAPIDLADGYIHASTAIQVVETAAKHFKGEKDVILLRLRSADFGGKLKWEVSRGGAEFPHYYGTLLMDHVETVYPLEREGAELIFPETY